MFIKVKNGRIFNMDNIVYMDYERMPCFVNNIYAYLVTDKHCTIGKYDTPERAEEVMNEIIDCCIAGIDIYNMPEE